MYYKFIRYIFAFIVILSFAHVAAQPCADTQPLISGAQSVTNSQSNVIYSTPNIPGHTYSWSVNGGTITSGMNTNQISVLWGPVGAGSVSVTEVNPALNCSTTVSRTIQVRPLLVAYLYYTNESCYGNTLSFFGDKCIADAQKPIVSYEWDFGDLGTSTLQNPTHTYNPPWNQTWTIRLIVTNSEGYKDTIYDAVYVNPDQYIPHPDFIASIPSCGYDAVQFDATPPISNTPPGTEPIWKYVWDFGDPSSPSNHDSTASPLTSHLFTTPGTYTVKLRIGNYKSCQGEITRTVTVLPSIPDASYAYSTPTCINNPTFFTDQSLPALNHNITKWEWNFGDGSTPVVVNSPATPNISHVYPGLGPYNTWLKVTNEIGCSDSIYRSISLTPSPIAGFKNLSNCVGDTVHFQSTSLTNNGPLIDSYYWDFGDPGSGFNISTNQNPIHLYGASGFYTVTLIIQNEAGCPDTLTKVIQIFDPPAVEYTYILGPQNNTVSFHLDQFITPVGRIGNMVQWNFGDGTFGYGYDPIHVYPAGGTFNVTLSVVDTNGCSNEVTHQIYVPALPMAFFSTNSPVCAGQPLCVTDLSNAATPPFGWITKWIWNWGDGSPDDTINFPNDPNLCHMYSLADTFSVTLTVFDNFGFSDSYTRDIIIMPNPIANFFFTGSCEDQVISFTDASFANGGGNIISYDWNFGDPLSGLNNQSNLQNPIHIFANGGVYQVRLIIENFQGCVDTIIKDVPVRFGPSIEFSYDTACLEQVTTFNACTGITQCDSIAVWSWNFGDGTPLVTDPVATSHLYIAPGTYTVTLTITDIHGCISTKTHTVIVNPLPIPAFSWSTPTCQDVAVTFTDESLVPAGYTGYIAKWQWDFGDGTPVQTITLPGLPNIVHLFPTTAISFNVKLTVWTSDSCTKFIEHTITLTPAPLANFGFSSVNCSSQAVNFTDLSQTNGGGSVTEWAWNFGDPGSGVNNFSSNQNPSHTYITSGPYTVTLIVKNVTGC
ncbi:MAG: PKD domain-containing protein, partial [Syntrophothermus sp.]